MIEILPDFNMHVNHEIFIIIYQFWPTSIAEHRYKNATSGAISLDPTLKQASISLAVGVNNLACETHSMLVESGLLVGLFSHSALTKFKVGLLFGGGGEKSSSPPAAYGLGD